MQYIIVQILAIFLRLQNHAQGVHNILNLYDNQRTGKNSAFSNRTLYTLLHF